MKLREYLKTYGISISHLARSLKLTNPTIQKILKGGGMQLSTAMKIENITERKVTCYDLYEAMQERIKLENESKDQKNKKTKENKRR